ncbi:PD-(D/E)XK nuclease family transposase [Succinatimonas hippei]|uniref:PD-(D/E)XK nuclease family transposase n=1 Tax=Succinatimonas hippei TaxID=626938 RepID=UPI00387F5B8C
MCTIEIQQYVEKDIGARAYYYAAKVLGSEITRGITYHKLTPVIIINFLTHNHLSTKNYHSCYHFNEDDEHSRLSDIVTFHFVEFPIMQKKEHGVMTRLEK